MLQRLDAIKGLGATSLSQKDRMRPSVRMKFDDLGENPRGARLKGLSCGAVHRAVLATILGGDASRQGNLGELKTSSRARGASSRRGTRRCKKGQLAKISYMGRGKRCARALDLSSRDQTLRLDRKGVLGAKRRCREQPEE